MSDQYTEYTTAAAVIDNNQPERQVLDNRVTIEVDPRKIEAWELIAIESGRLTEWLVIFSYYAARRGRLVSPELPKKPWRELTSQERSVIQSSEAYRLLERFDLQQLRSAAEAFTSSLEAGF